MNQNILPPRSYHDRLHDQKIIEKIAQENPEFIKVVNPQFTEKDLELIGIEEYNENLPLGYIKNLESDFIVEEITKDDQKVTVSAITNQDIPYILPGRAVFLGTLIKKTMSTIEAVERISETLNLPLNCIKYAGIKDAKAITAQKISLSRLDRPDLEKLNNIPNMLFKDWESVANPIDIGHLKANVFTITIRTKEKIDAEKFVNNLEQIKKFGFLNYYSFQRFGSRAINAKLGKLILLKKYEEIIKVYMTEVNGFESPYYHQIRNEIKENWGNWEKIVEILEPFKYFFYYEKAIAKTLLNNPNGFVEALQVMQSQTQIFTYAYFSYLYNQLLSKMIKEKVAIPQELPLYRPYPQIQELYCKYFPKEEFLGLDFINQPPYLNLRKEQYVLTRILPQINNYFVGDNYAIIDFTLGKGAYATAFLSNLFDLRSGWPKPEWINDEKIDSKKILDEESIVETENLFKEFPEEEKPIEEE